MKLRVIPSEYTDDYYHDYHHVEFQTPQNPRWEPISSWSTQELAEQAKRTFEALWHAYERKRRP